DLTPRRTLLTFGERGEDCVAFAAGLDDLAAAEIFFGVVEGIKDHAFDLLVSESVTGLNFDLGFLAAALLTCRNMQDAVGVDEKLYLDASHARGHRWNALEIEARERTAISGQFALALQNVNRDVGLSVDLRSVVLRRRGRNGGVAQNNLVGHSSCDFDAKRKRRDIEQ